MRSFLLTFLCFLLAAAAFADRPLKTVYKKSITRDFKGTWSKHPKQTYTIIQKSHGSSKQAEKISYATRDDVSNYRFHNSHRVYQNGWGYFFPDGTKAVRNNGAVIFKSPKGYVVANQK
jgi:ABC-type sulfate transport system substrate-binding protein